MRIAITGGSGFIGSNLINLLNKKKFILSDKDGMGISFKEFKTKIKTL